MNCATCGREVIQMNPVQNYVCSVCAQERGERAARELLGMLDDLLYRKVKRINSNVHAQLDELLDR